MPRHFTPTELTSSLTLADYRALSPADRDAFDRALTALWLSNTAQADLRALSRDYDLIASNRRFEIGE